MALLTYTFAQLKSAAAHAIGRTPDSGTSTGDIVNNALAYLANAHAWKWLQKALSLAYTADQSYIALPADFRELLLLKGPANSQRRVISSSMEEIIGLRQLTATTGGDVWYALSWTPQTVATASPIARLEIYPTPAATESGALAGLYIRSIAALSSDSDLADIPPHLHPTLRQLCRAHAHSDEEPADPESVPEWQLALDMLRKDIAADGISQRRYGILKGAVSMGGRLAAEDEFPYAAVTA